MSPSGRPVRAAARPAALPPHRLRGHARRRRTSAAPFANDLEGCRSTCGAGRCRVRRVAPETPPGRCVLQRHQRQEQALGESLACNVRVGEHRRRGGLAILRTSLDLETPQSPPAAPTAERRSAASRRGGRQLMHAARRGAHSQLNESKRWPTGMGHGPWAMGHGLWAMGRSDHHRARPDPRHPASLLNNHPGYDDQDLGDAGRPAASARRQPRRASAHLLIAFLQATARSPVVTDLGSPPSPSPMLGLGRSGRAELRHGRPGLAYPQGVSYSVLRRERTR